MKLGEIPVEIHITSDDCSDALRKNLTVEVSYLFNIKYPFLEVKFSLKIFSFIDIVYNYGYSVKSDDFIGT